MTTSGHYFGAQALPINRNRVVCLHCGRIKEMGKALTGRRAKCSKTLRYEYLGNGATASVSIANGKVRRSDGGHADYRAGSGGHG